MEDLWRIYGGFMEDNGGIGGAMRWPLLLSLPSGSQVWRVGSTLHTHPSRERAESARPGGRVQRCPHTARAGTV